MATVTVYTFIGGLEDDPREDWGTFTTQDYQEAKDYARANGLGVVANEFEFSDSELVDDFRPVNDELDERSRDASE